MAFFDRSSRTLPLWAAIDAMIAALASPRPTMIMISVIGTLKPASDRARARSPGRGPGMKCSRRISRLVAASTAPVRRLSGSGRNQRVFVPLDTSLCIVVGRDHLPAATRLPAPVSPLGDRVARLRLDGDGDDRAHPLARRAGRERD